MSQHPGLASSLVISGAICLVSAGALAALWQMAGAVAGVVPMVAAGLEFCL